MKIEIPRRPTAWACRVCGKVDWADDKKQLAQPEHISYRGVDIGECIGRGGEMIPLYSEDDILKANTPADARAARRVRPVVGPEGPNDLR